ncbi:MAG: cation-translocating P-type ATPase [Pseudomonadota bacterium]
MLGAGLFLVGLLIGRAGGQFEVGQLFQFAAALMVGAGVLHQALRGFFSVPPYNYSEQLVALAVLAAIASGDFLSATLVPLLLEIGHLFEERSALGAQAAIDRLGQLCARTATVSIDEQEREMPAEVIEPGHLLIVRPGEVIAADGVVQSGHASLDQSPVTGESSPNGVGPGDAVYAGTINLDGLLEVRVQKAGRGTVLGEVIRILREVESAKTPVVRLLERGAAVYLPAVVTLAALTLFVTGELSRFVTVLVVACPCALILAAPAAMVAAMATATKRSILIKNAAFLERVATVDTLVLDKTGTLTDSVQSVDRVQPCDGTTEDDILRLAAAVAHGSRHPAARAVNSEAQARKLAVPVARDTREYPGRGVRATVDGATVQIGRASWLRQCGVAGRLESQGAGVWLARDGTALGFIALSDHLKEGAEEAIAQMRALGFARIVLLTGDREQVAKPVGERLKLNEVIAEVLPAEKLCVVEREQAAGRRVLMVGDGINDALAMSAADVGVAVGAQINEVALGGADVALLSNELRCLPDAVALADRTRRVVLENVVVGLTFSVGMLAIASAGWINPVTGALLHNAGAVFVVFNSSRLLERGNPLEPTGV